MALAGDLQPLPLAVTAATASRTARSSTARARLGTARVVPSYSANIVVGEFAVVLEMSCFGVDKAWMRWLPLLPGCHAAIGLCLGELIMFGRTTIRVARIVAGVAFLILGFLGLFLPFLQGILFLTIGLTLLSHESERARQWSEWLRSYLHRKNSTSVERNEP